MLCLSLIANTYLIFRKCIDNESKFDWQCDKCSKCDSVPLAILIIKAQPSRRLQPDIAGGGCFYDLAPHQLLDILQNYLGGYHSGTWLLYCRAFICIKLKIPLSVRVSFENGLPGSASWCFGHQSAKRRLYRNRGEKG